MTAYYNEHDPRAAAWLRALIDANLIAPGVVDERSITEVRPTDVAGFTQVHFFAGIGVWSAALRGAGWSDDRPVWTGSCPCQPFSAAGKGAGFDDTRHLWPDFFRLIRECRPDAVFGEQVASKDGLAWLDLVHADLEGAGYAVGAADLCAAGIGAPHIRQRLYWVADAGGNGARQHARELRGHEGEHEVRAAHGDYAPIAGSAARGLAHTNVEGLEGRGLLGANRGGHGAGERAPGPLGAAVVLADAGCTSGAWGSGERSERPATSSAARELPPAGVGGVAGGWAGATNGHWGAADWLLCRDGKWRPVEPGTFPLAHGAPARVGRLRGYGNAIVLPLAQAFVEAFLEAKAVLAVQEAA